MMGIRKLKRTLVRQHDQADCGIACLLSIINFYEGSEKLEKIRELSGTSNTGTSLLGLYQAANSLGFIAVGYESDIEYLKGIKQPVILHLNLQGNLQHFVCYYGFIEKKGFLIGDPSDGLKYLTLEELAEFWKTKVLLELTPDSSFKTNMYVNTEKFSWLKRLISADINILSVSLFIGVIISILGLSIYIFSQKLIDDILPHAKLDKLILGIILLSLLLCIKGFLSYIHQYFGIKQSKDFNLRIIDSFYSNLLKLPVPFFDNRKTGDLVSRLNDTLSIQQTVAYIVNNIILNFLILLVSSIIIFFYSKIAGIIIISALPVFILISWSFQYRIVKTQRGVMEAHAINESNYINTIQNVSVIKSTNKEINYTNLNKIIFGLYQESVFRLGRININLGLAAELIGLVYSIALITLNSIMVINKTLTIGEFTAILGISTGMFSSIAVLAFANLQLQGARIAFDRMYEFAGLKKEYEISDIENKIKINEIDKVTISNISFRFPGNKRLLNSISLNVNKGEIITIFGESGAGKSTLLKIIQQFYTHENGQILINDKNIEELSLFHTRNLISYLPQESGLFNHSLIDNICMGVENERDLNSVIQFCCEFGFNHFFESFPQAYASILGEGGIKLSGGQQQLVLLARALYRKPKLLLLDEPTSAMDRETENFVLHLLQEYKKNAMIILVTHKIRAAKISDRIYVLKEGTISISGSHLRLINTENDYSLTYRELVE